MPNTPPSGKPTLQEVQARLQEVARALRGPGSLKPEVHLALAELLDELSATLKAPNAPPPEVAHLAESATHLAQSLHDRHDQGLLEQARDRLAETVFQA